MVMVAVIALSSFLFRDYVSDYAIMFLVMHMVLSCDVASGINDKAAWVVVLELHVVSVAMLPVSFAIPCVVPMYMLRSWWQCCMWLS